MNLCRSCKQDFSSVANFDLHRVGKHEYTFAEGLRFDPPVEDGRRCLGIDELEMRNLSLDKHGRWHDPTKAAATRLWATVNVTEAS